MKKKNNDFGILIFFEMGKLDSVPLCMTCNCYFAKLRIKDVYCSLSDKKGYQTFLIGEGRLRNLLILVKRKVLRQ